MPVILDPELKALMAKDRAVKEIKNSRRQRQQLREIE